MKVMPVLFEDELEIIQYSSQWDLHYPNDIYSRFDTYISDFRVLGSWGSNGTLDEIFLIIF